jgi:hypothetical protein
MFGESTHARNMSIISAFFDMFLRRVARIDMPQRLCRHGRFVISAPMRNGGRLAAKSLIVKSFLISSQTDLAAQAGARGLKC